MICDVQFLLWVINDDDQIGCSENLWGRVIAMSFGRMITENPNMMLEMMIAEIAGKIYNGACDRRAVRLEVT